MAVREGFIESIGNTPLIKLKAASQITGCTILGKAEFLNPGGSVKDRAALGIVRDAERSGKLKAGGVIVEGTAGNTGIGITLVANVLGYKSVIVMPETQSQEKKDMLKLCGAKLNLVPAAPYKDPNNYIRYSERLSLDLSDKNGGNVLWANQFDNTANYKSHEMSTGPEIWEQTNGTVDGFICAVGSGGTLTGVGNALKQRNPKIKIGLADPMGSALFNYYRDGELKSEGNSISEGIGQGRITKNLEKAIVDECFQITDHQALPIIYNLLQDEGLCMGGSTGINIAGAIELGKKMGPGHTIVTILCDWGHRYQSKVFNPSFLREKGLPIPNWLD
ncbi:MAG: cysteine synthase A [Thalassobaculaceae bacterium]|tara:strand:+ start:112 stop:1113 length:1002 start_codon:yes stop_codon:yes gene_type:complete